MIILWILERILAFFEVAIVTYFYKKVLGTKQKWVFPIMTLVLFIMISLRGTFSINAISSIQPTLEILAIHLIHIFFLLFFFNGKPTKKFITFAGYFLLSFVCDFLTFTLTGALGIKNETIFTIVMYFMMTTLLALVLSIFASYIENFTKISDKKIYIAFTLIPITQFGFITLAIILMNQFGIITDSNKSISSQTFAIILSALLFFSLIADFVFLKVTYSATENIKNKEKLRSLEEESLLQYKYYQELQANTNKMRKYRHDTNNIIQSIYAVLDNPDNNAKAKAAELAKTLEKEINAVNLEN